MVISAELILLVFSFVVLCLAPLTLYTSLTCMQIIDFLACEPLGRAHHMRIQFRGVHAASMFICQEPTHKKPGGSTIICQEPKTSSSQEN